MDQQAYTFVEQGDNWRGGTCMMPAYVRWVRWSALISIGGQSLFLLGFLLPYATLSTGQQRWFLAVTWNTLLTRLQQGDLSVLYGILCHRGTCLPRLAIHG
jgi:hypothetical protein